MLVFSLKASESEKILGLDYEAVVVDDVPCDAVVLLGYFDGVHRGHGELIDEALALAGDSRDVVVWTPEAVPKASAERGLLNTRAEKLRLFGSFSADYAVLDSFEDIRSMDGESFFSLAYCGAFSSLCRGMRREFQIRQRGFMHFSRS